jgi:hypothetical protein
MGFLLHIRPQFFRTFLESVELVDMALEPLGLKLKGGVDVIARRPYPNKGYLVACRREGRKAVEGILVDMHDAPGMLVSTTRWAIDAQLVVTHQVHYQLLDREFDAASDDMTLWYACEPENIGVSPDSFKGWSNRRPAWTNDLAPYLLEPKMAIMAIPRRDQEKALEAQTRTRTVDIANEKGLCIERSQHFALPTIERERITTLNAITRSMRLPAIGSAFRVP